MYTIPYLGVWICKTKSMQKYIDIYNVGNEKLDDDFDLHEYVMNMREIRKNRLWI